MYEREGLVFHSLGRREDGNATPDLGPAVSWAPDGSLIAATQNLRNEAMQVVFFERNGLRHREFPLPPSLVHPATQEVEFLDWNLETDLLLLGANDKAQGGGGLLQLWHRDNYHWYLKFQRRFEAPLTHLAFDAEKPYRVSAAVRGGYSLQHKSCPMSLIAAAGCSDDDGSVSVESRPTATSQLYPRCRLPFSCFRTCVCANAGQSWWACLDLCWDVAVSRSASNSVAVVDGLDLNLTPLARALVPPPMCHTKVRPPSWILQ